MRKTLYIVASLLLLGLTANFAAAQTSDEVTALVKQTKADIEKNALQTLARVNRAEHPYKNKDNPPCIYLFLIPI